MTEEKKTAEQTTETQPEQRQQDRPEPAVKSGKHAKAPEGLFNNPQQTPANPQRVKIILAQLDEYIAHSGRNVVKSEQTRMASFALFNALRNFATLEGGDLKRVYHELLNRMREHKAGAFSRVMVLRDIKEIRDTRDRDLIVGILNVFLPLASQSNPANLHQQVNVAYSLRHIRNAATLQQLQGLLPQK